jgi:enoyl-CoA hydratase
METLTVIRQEQVAVVTLNRPEALNALNTQMAVALEAAMGELGADPQVRCIVLTGAGDRAFCAGADLKERNGMSTEAWLQQHGQFQKAARALLGCSLPLIAAVEGFALGGGLELALCADFMIAGESAVLGLPETTRGLIPGLGGTQTLARAVGRRRAKELIFTGRTIKAEEAREWGLVNQVVPAGTALAASLETAATIAANAPIAVRQAKTAVDTGVEIDLQSAWRLSLEAYRVLIPTEDRLEGIRAFNEKRHPRFQNR